MHDSLSGWRDKDGYTKLAGLALQCQWRLYYFRPKLHQFLHVVLNLSLSGDGPAINPISSLEASVIM